MTRIHNDTPLFQHSVPLSERLAEDHFLIEQAVEREPDAALLNADAQKWVGGLAEAHRHVPPSPRIDDADFRDEGPVQANVAGQPGISMNIVELHSDTVLRDGHRIVVTVPVDGEIELLKYWPVTGASEHPGEIADDTIQLRFEWPLELGAPAMRDRVEELLVQLQAGAANVALQVEEHNRALVEHAQGVIQRRRAYLLQHQSFLDDLNVPIRRRDDAPTERRPIMRRRVTGAARVRPAAGAAPMQIDGAALNQLYSDVLTLIRSMAVTMERSPASYADKDEETLRDQLLTILNTHFEGHTYSEAFNKDGKTDLLIRLDGRNIFIGECKKWHGAQRLNDALDQLRGYATWRDVRLALIIFVGNEHLPPVIDTTREQLEARPEFAGWVTSEDGELRGRLRWTGDGQHDAVLAVIFVHLPRA
jgi:hypothetical protein